VPLPNQEILVTSDFGTLDRTSAVSDESGEAVFVIASPATGTATITATGTVMVPMSRRFASKEQPLTTQPIGIPGAQTITVIGHATKTWVLGPGAAASACGPGDAWCTPDAVANIDGAVGRIFLPMASR
jgi:hypothetical protein